MGDKIQDFTVTTFDGKTVTLSEVLKEKDMVLINIWATWCGPAALSSLSCSRRMSSIRTG